MQATIYTGRPNLLMDHLQLGLRLDGQTDPSFYISLYAIPWSRDLGSGHVALVRQRSNDGTLTDRILSDNPSLARGLVAQLRAVGYARVDLTGEPRPASFIRSPLKEQQHVRFLVAAVGLEIEARWDDLGEPIFAYGPAPQRLDTQEIWSMLFEAGEPSAAVNGTAVPGRAYPLEHWVPWLGRPLNSAHVARGEILVDRPMEPVATPKRSKKAARRG